MGLIKEAELPGLGKKYLLELEGGERIGVVVYDEGLRDLFYFPAGESEPAYTVTLTDQEARQIASILGGVFYQPKMLEKLEMAIADLRIEWLKVAPQAPAVGKSIGELNLRKNHGITVIAIIEDAGRGKKKCTAINPGPSFVFLPGQMVVAAGKAGDIEAFEEMITGGGVQNGAV
ncbi:cation:proton antiporter regulatory subunit [Desulfofundulus sp. TPOSR]|jgi:TrkA domain protein|uniref:TrkA-C domain protein n=1 Tax=Desulfofundulus kuznetsovii (strain DSM 6115 / VKM B-1805 / 17) TaxID=760568 RepID=A0AAU8PV70_DESK7|nr:TrkA C-terminal domain-containing protein [Desulfofundulus sp. TPOSR]AEG14964.1 TrkA-C domain protein [Desulfofundulus kuznetsovii DSM 6115]NHM25571.1 cation:proton antiporter regulatory subunit [Desulfofundulus sp. TPOSR]